MVRGAEAARLEEVRTGVPWKQWGPYLSERQWGTVREDYSDNGDAWSYFSHDQARSRAYKWGEDGIAGLCDDRQRLCFGIALWNGVDPILKERMFGLTNAEGNHGEDVKEYYFYLDATPTSSYLKYRYRYPLVEFPYDDLTQRTAHGAETSWSTSWSTPACSTTTAMSMSTSNMPRPRPTTSTYASRSPTAATSRRQVHLLPSLWFRNSWWMGEPKGALHAPERPGRAVIAAQHPSAREISSCSVRETRSSCSPTTRPTPNDCGDRQTRLRT